MARSPSGKLLGAAAHTEIRDIQEAEDHRRYNFSRDWNQTIQALEYFMGDTFEAWWDSYDPMMSKQNFLPIMKAKLDDLDGTTPAKVTAYDR